MTSREPSTVDEAQWVLANEAATLGFGRQFAAQLQPGDVVFLQGDLGAGKTTLTRGLLRALGVEGHVKSPTYALVEVYAVSRLNLYHFDFYRMSDPEEWHEAGFRDFFSPTTICVVEWPQKAQGAGVKLPQPTWDLTLSPYQPSSASEPQRLLRVRAPSSRLSALKRSALPSPT